MASNKSRGSRSKKPTRRVVAKRIVSRPGNKSRQKASWANDDMTIDDLRFMAKSKGIPFGGLSKAKLILKINNYKN